MMLSADECFIARDILFPDRIHTRAREREKNATFLQDIVLD